MLEAITYDGMMNELKNRWGSKNKTFGMVLIKLNKSKFLWY